MKLGSLFDGSGGFPLAGALCGIVPAWASEIEPYPIAVTRSRFPSMKHFGDIRKISGAGIEPVDVITFGSPCQDLSAAGKREGLKHEDNDDGETTRSGLFMDAVRIIKEMREETNGIYPRFAIWENVFGAFSSNKGEDFRLVLQSIIKIVEPTAVVLEVPKGGWAYADCWMGDGWSVGWRTFDAQYWGVPQRRRRIYLVADFRGECAGEILFKREGVSGYTPQGFRAWQRTAGAFEKGIGTAGCVCCGETPKTLKIRSGQDNKSATLGCNNDQTVVVPFAKGTRPHSPNEGQEWKAADVANTLNTYDVGESRCNELAVKVYGICSKQSHSMLSDNPKSGFYEADTSRCLDANGGNPSCNQGGMAVLALQGSMIGRADKNGPQGSGVNEDVSFTLDAADRHAVAYCMTAGSYTQTLKEQSPTLMARGYKDTPDVNETEPEYIVRRLTPTECARLQGFPGCWGYPEQKSDFSDVDYKFWLDIRNTHATINGRTAKEYTKEQILKWYNKLHTDCAEYKMWGNGIALPCALYIMQGIIELTLKKQLAEVTAEMDAAIEDLSGQCEYCYEEKDCVTRKGPHWIFGIPQLERMNNNG